MSRSTGPILATGAITWSNQVLLTDEDLSAEKRFSETARIGVATGMLAGLFYLLEKVAGDIATGLAWVALATSLLVRFNNKPTPLERALDLVG